ncbi:MAG: amino acid adenylation domain-containing protein [Verrucomicrobiota bacterium]
MGVLLHQSVQLRAGTHSEKTAFRCRERYIDYSELHAQSIALSQTLIRLGLEPSGRVGIFMEKDLETPVSVYGILAAGGVYVPIDPRSGIERLEYIIRDCEIDILISSESKISILKELEERKSASLRKVIGLRENAFKTIASIPWIQALNKGDKSQSELREIQEDDLAYIIYTSGSTGVPKGMMHTHRSGLSYAQYATDLYDVDDSDIFASHAPIHFDISKFDLFGAPLCGATSVLIPEEELAFPAGLPDLIEREKITLWYSVPLALIQISSTGAIANADLSSLRWVLFAGEAFPPNHLASLMEQLPTPRYSNIYGPAETNQCTFYHIPWKDFDAREPLPLGEVWQGASYKVIGDDEQEVEAGQIGELIIHSTTTMKGYWKRPDLDANAFYVDASGRRFYRTGDSVSIDNQGLLQFHGRRDRQIKLRGYRIELDEIEATINAHNDIELCAVVLSQRNPEEKSINAYLVPKAQSNYSKESLKKSILKKLPHYSVPDQFVVLDSLPETSTGKIDRTQLLQIDCLQK